MGGLDSFVLLCAMAASPAPAAQDGSRVATISEITLPAVGGAFDRLLIQSPAEDLRDPKKSPKGRWTFNRITSGFGRSQPDAEFNNRFRIFSENAQDQKALGVPTARLLLRLWEHNVDRLRLDHSREFLGGAVDVYLTRQGNPGGEQLFDEDPFTTTAAGVPRKVNTVYIYGVNSWNRAIDRVREVAHEYGHATLPKLGGFTEPEEWADGDLGERIYLRYLRDEMAAGRIPPADAFGITVAELDRYLAEDYEPLVRLGATQGPDRAVIARRDAASYRTALGILLWAKTILPRRSFGRGLVLASAEQDPNKTGAALAEAAAEPDRTDLAMPAWAVGQTLWIPVGDRRIAGGTVVSRAGGWARVRVGARTMTLTKP